MSSSASAQAIGLILHWMPLIALAAVCFIFGSLSERFLSPDNLISILAQSSWLIVVALGVNFVLLAAGVDLSVGAAMYLAAVVLGLGLQAAPVWVCFLAAILTGALFGAVNGLLITRLGLPAFIVTLAAIFAGRGIGFYLSSTKIVFASSAIADLGRARLAGVPVALCLAGVAVLISAIILRATPLGPYIRSVGADRQGASRAGVPTNAVTFGVYALSGAFAGFGSFIAFSQSASASGSFGQNAEFLAIAAAVLGGTSLFGGRGRLWAPVLGAVLITTVQNGLVMINANPYAYPVITGTVIFLAALLDSIRLRFIARAERRPIRRDEESNAAPLRSMHSAENGIDAQGIRLP